MASAYALSENRAIRTNQSIMDLDPQAIFANLVEKEKVRGHHSAEGRAIRTLGRAINGWTIRSLSALDVLVLCDQAIEDWLKGRLNVPIWSTRNFTALLEKAVEKSFLLRSDAVRLQRIHELRSGLDNQHDKLDRREAETALIFCIQLIEKHW
jgi:hypothetical protein